MSLARLELVHSIEHATKLVLTIAVNGIVATIKQVSIMCKAYDYITGTIELSDVEYALVFGHDRVDIDSRATSLPEPRTPTREEQQAEMLADELELRKLFG